MGKPQPPSKGFKEYWLLERETEDEPEHPGRPAD
jgi:hypothetical protein